jgi:hypothetical protein
MRTSRRVDGTSRVTKEGDDKYGAFEPALPWAV